MPVNTHKPTKMKTVYLRRRLKVRLLLLKFVMVLTFISGSASAQSIEDFKVKTDFVDTLVTGYVNIVSIESDYNQGELTLTSDTAVVKYNAGKEKYEVIVPTGRRYVSLVVVCKKNDGTVAEFAYVFRVVPLTDEMINRVYKKE